MQTIERIAAAAPWNPPRQAPTPTTIVDIQVVWGVAAVARRSKEAGGQWRRDYTLWALRYAQAEQLDLLDQMVEPKVE